MYVASGHKNDNLFGTQTEQHLWDLGVVRTPRPPPPPPQRMDMGGGGRLANILHEPSKYQVHRSLQKHKNHKTAQNVGDLIAVRHTFRSPSPK